MSEIALAKINSFASTAMQADFPVSPSEPSITLSLSQLRGLIQEAFQPLQDEVMGLREERDQDRQEIAALRREVRLQGARTDDSFDAISEIDNIIAKLVKAPTPSGEKTVARIAKIDEVLKSRGPTTLKQLEHILGIDRATMTRLLVKLDMRRYELHARPGDAREKVLRLKVQIH